MSTRSGAFFQRVIRAIVRGSVPVDSSQCDAQCVVKAPADCAQARCDRDRDRQEPIRWVSLR